MRLRPSDSTSSYQSPKLAALVDSSIEGHGLYATARIARGELLVSWGGVVLGRAGFNLLTAKLRSISLQIDDDQFLVPTRPCAADRVNHSCEPNAGMSGAIALVALREIRAGEEIRYDYAMSDGSDYDEFECQCGARRCRGRVTGNDWRDPSLWARYVGHFSPYLERRISALRAAGERPRAGPGPVAEAFRRARDHLTRAWSRRDQGTGSKPAQALSMTSIASAKNEP